MTIKSKLKDNIKYFSDVEIGGAFMFNCDLYIKIELAKYTNEEDCEVPINAVNLATGETGYFDPYDAIKKVKATVVIDEN